MDTEPHKIILISEKSVPYIDQSTLEAYTAVSADTIVSSIEEKSAPAPSSLLALIFIEADEYPSVSEKLTLLSSQSLIYQFVIFGDEKKIASVFIPRICAVSEIRTSKISAFEFSFIIRKSFGTMNEILEEKNLQSQYLARLMDTRQDQEDLISIGQSLSSEKDPDKLLRLILFLSKKITGADAGSIYLIEEDENGRKRMRFKYSHTFSREIPLEEFVMDLNKKSIAGYVAVTGEVQNVPDVYKLPGDSPYKFNSSFDNNNSYTTRSMLVVPMRNHAGDIIGVIQLINSKEDRIRHGEMENEAFTIKLVTPEDFDNYVVTFNEKYDNLLGAIAGQAAIAIENNRLIKQIQEQFEEFVKASVTAIESRDPATSGHSFRVAEICREMALAVNNINEGYLKEFRFSSNDLRELEFASLLHDFGKVYIDLSVFTKSKKLYPKDFENLELRLSYLYRFVELDFAGRETEALKRMSKNDDTDKYIVSIASEKKLILDEIRKIKGMITSLNEPALTEEDPADTLKKISKAVESLQCLTIDGDCLDVITDDDRLNLTIKRGSLNPEERKEIESHVVHTYNFVSKIPWPPEYRRIPEIALRHHEKLNGTGYPDGLKGRESITIQSRMMAIADIYDALAAGDRPYKKAVPIEKILNILREEAARDVLDHDLVDLFINEKIYERVSH